MDSLLQPLPISCTIVLSDHDPRAGGKAHKAVYNQPYDGCIRTSHRCQSLFPNIFIQYDSIHCVV